METYRFRFTKAKTFRSLSQTWSKGEIWQLGKGWILCDTTHLGLLMRTLVLDNSWYILNESAHVIRTSLWVTFYFMEISLLLLRHQVFRGCPELFFTFFWSCFTLIQVFFLTQYFYLAWNFLVSSSIVELLIMDVWLRNNSKPE